jgi:hypothetical protein
LTTAPGATIDGLGLGVADRGSGATFGIFRVYRGCSGLSAYLRTSAMYRRHCHFLPGSVWWSMPPTPGPEGSSTSLWPITCRRSRGTFARAASHATSRAEASYWALVKPPRRVKPSCSIPIECRFTQRLPACHATSDVLTSWTMSPPREIT